MGNKKLRHQIQKGAKKGLTPNEIQHMREIARKQAQAMEQEATEKAFLYMLAIPLNVLISEYWPKSAKKKAPKFIDECCSLFESVQAGAVTDRELADLLYDMAGLKIEAEWLKAKGENDETAEKVNEKSKGIHGEQGIKSK